MKRAWTASPPVSVGKARSLWSAMAPTRKRRPKWRRSHSGEYPATVTSAPYTLPSTWNSYEHLKSRSHRVQILQRAFDPKSTAIGQMFAASTMATSLRGLFSFQSTGACATKHCEWTVEHVYPCGLKP